MSVVVKQLKKVYDSQIAVNAISFEINKGSIVGFLGPNGAGKSTSMKMLTTYLMPTSGTATLAGYDILEQPIEVRKRVGYLPESNPLYYDMYVKEYLHFAAQIHQLGKHSAARIQEMIALTGLEREAHKKIGALSKGYKQRVGLAQALIHDPEILILDEPTSGLDPNQLADIRQLIINIGKEKTVLLSTHIMQEVEAMCERVIIINQGNLVADKPIADFRSTQTATGEIQLKIKIQETVDENTWMRIKAIKHVRKQDDYWLITAEEKADLRSDLVQLIYQQKLNLIEWQTHTSNLEHVFRELTQKSTTNI